MVAWARGGGWPVVVALATTLAAGWGRAAPASRAPAAIGTVRASGIVEVSLDGVGWQPMVGGGLVAGAGLRTGPGGWATLDLPGGDVVGLDETTSVQALQASPPELRLDAGRLALTLRPGSTTMVDTPRGTVRAPLGAAGAGRERRAVVVVDGGETTVEVLEGDVDVIERGGVVVSVSESQRASLLAGAAGAVIRSIAGTPDDPNRPRQPGNPASDPPLKPSPLMAQLWVAVAVIVSGVVASLGML